MIVAALITSLIVVLASWLRHVRKVQQLTPEKQTFVPEAPTGSIPRPGSRRWARALYHNNIIDLEELNAFYVQHPEDFSDSDR